MRYEVISRPKAGYKYPKVISFDTEYSDLDLKKAELLSISIGVSPELTYILEDFRAVKKFITDAEIVLTWNGVVDFFMIERHFKEKFDTSKNIDGMLLEHLIDERLNHGLGDFALREYEDDYKAIFWKTYETYQEAPKEAAYVYEMRDGVYTYLAGKRYLSALRSQTELIRHVHRLQSTFFETEIRGLKVNTELMKLTKSNMSAEISSYLKQLRGEHHEFCQLWELQQWNKELNKRSTDKGKLGVHHPEFSFTSDKQLNWLIYDAMECPVLEKTVKGTPKTDVGTIQRLCEDYPQLTTVAKYKGCKSVYATFVGGMLDRVENDRIYPRFNVNGTTTGRISHSNPNMGNLPTDGVIRNFFLPDDGHSFVGADYSQLEVVIEANLTEDKSLLKIILEGASKHDITAQGLGISRESAKTLNFALQYGAAAPKVAKILGVSKAEAEDIFRRYWEIYSGVKNLKDQVSAQIKSQGYVTNLFGRSRHFSRPRNEWEGYKQERQGYNHLIQGVGADMTNMACYEISQRFKERELGQFVLSVHDEVLTQAKKHLIEEAKAAIVEGMDIPSKVIALKYPVQNKLYGPLDYWSKT